VNLTAKWAKYFDGWDADEANYKGYTHGVPIGEGAIGCICKCGSKGMGFDPHSGQSKVTLFALSI
jgi:hypothetical protein